MTHKIIENNNEAYIIFEGKLDVDDAADGKIFELFHKNIKLTVDISKVSCYNEFVVGYKELCDQFGITLKERKQNETKSNC